MSTKSKFEPWRDFIWIFKISKWSQISSLLKV
uniref:Uncharacterized protein n=1 Tax=Arundo donax TaxID=35708 RepID=A0A0A9DFT7_ARUDO